jgi:hypothetical protein
LRAGAVTGTSPIGRLRATPSTEASARTAETNARLVLSTVSRPTSVLILVTRPPARCTAASAAATVEASVASTTYSFAVAWAT